MRQTSSRAQSQGAGPAARAIDPSGHVCVHTPFLKLSIGPPSPPRCLAQYPLAEAIQNPNPNPSPRKKMLWHSPSWRHSPGWRHNFPCCGAAVSCRRTAAPLTSHVLIHALRIHVLDPARPTQDRGCRWGGVGWCLQGVGQDSRPTLMDIRGLLWHTHSQPAGGGTRGTACVGLGAGGGQSPICSPTRRPAVRPQPGSTIGGGSR